MPIPLIVWGGIALIGGTTAAGYGMGQKMGEGVRKSVPLLLGGTALYLLMKDGK